MGGFFKRNKILINPRDVDKYMSKITEYIKETKTELKHVIWPNKTLTSYYTIIVIILSILIAYFLGLFDFLFSIGLEKLISL